MEQFNEEKVYTVVKNITKNSKAVLSDLNGVEIGPGETVNLRAMFRKAQLVDASQQIHHFISIGCLAEITGEEVQPEAPSKEEETQEQGKPKDMSQIQMDMKAKIKEAKNRDLINEITGSTQLTRLEDILTSEETPDEARKAAKLRYMELRGWADENGQLLPGATDDDNQEITSIDAWEFKPFRITDGTAIIQ